MSGSNLLFVLSGSIAAYKACEVISQLVQRGHRVRCVATESALRFVGAATLEGLTGSAVLTDLFAAGHAMDHIALTRWADGVVVCPATANTLNRLAAGLADDLPGALFLAHDRRKPWLVAPAMNPAMWRHPATEAAVRQLRGWGVRVLPVGSGRTACGEQGEGRLLEAAELVAAVESALLPPARRLRVLVTAGGTAEPIDGVRVLTNTSTGATGALIAAQLARRGHEVVLLRARSAVAAPECREELFTSFADLAAALARRLPAEDFDAVVHAAAVSDYGVDLVVEADGTTAPAAAAGKLASGGAPVLRLRPNPRLVDGLRALGRTPFTLVAFKLTHGADAAAAQVAVATLLARSGADFVVHNDGAARASAASPFPATIHRADGTVAATCPDRLALAAALTELLENTHSLVPCSSP